LPAAERSQYSFHLLLPAAVNELPAAIHSLGDVAPFAVYSEH
jgi:hypothetical protein